MKLAQEFTGLELDRIKAALDGGTLKIYSVARPASPDKPIDRSGLLVSYQFAAPAFTGDEPQFVNNPATPEGIGTPGFARAFNADGAVIADFSAGAGDAEIKLNEVSATTGFPLTLTRLKLELPAA